MRNMMETFSRKLFTGLLVNILLLLISSVGVCTNACAATATDSATVELLQLLNNIHNMRADFTQVTFGKMGAPISATTGAGGSSSAAPTARQRQSTAAVAPTSTTSSGKMALMRPGKFRWEIVQPNKQLIVANGRHVWVYDVDLEQVTKQTFDSKQPGNPAQLLSGDSAALRSTFKVTRLITSSSAENSSSANHEDSFELRPKSKNSMYNWIQLVFRSGKLSRMTMEDNLGQKNQFDFTNLTINAGIPESSFIFNAPPGVDVIDNAG